MEESGHPTPQPSPAAQRPTLFEELSAFVQQLPAGVFAALALIGIFILYQIVGGALTLILFGLDISAADTTGIRVVTMVGQILFLLLPTVILARLRFPSVTNIFRLGGINVKEIAAVIIAVVALQQVLQGYLLVQEAIPVGFPPVVQRFIDEVKQMMKQMYDMLTAAESLPEFLFVVLVIAVTPAVCEELLFRGLIQRTLERSSVERYGLRAAVLAGVIFGLYHLNPFTLIPLMALGVYFGFVVYRTQNILPAIVAHFCNNFLACLVLYLRLDENFVALSPTERPDALILALNILLGAVVFLAATYYLVRITKRPAAGTLANMPPPGSTSV